MMDRNEKSSSIVNEEQDIEYFGISASIPNYAVCRLSFYLKCCMIGCNAPLATFDKSLIKYDRAQFYSAAQQYLILQLALGEFNIHHLLNKYIFLDEQRRLLPKNSNNAFFMLRDVLNHFNIAESSSMCHEELYDHDLTTFSSRGGDSKVMLCTDFWINEIYIKPVLAMQCSFANLPLNVCQTITSQHCVHCQGMQANCTCEYGCPNTTTSCCKSYHRGIICSACKLGYIRGIRYRCTVCTGCNLCEDCYDHGEHDHLHPFERITRPGRIPESISSRVVLVEKTNRSQSDQDRIPLALAVPINAALALVETE